MEIEIRKSEALPITIDKSSTAIEIGIAAGGSTNYNDLSHKPQINSHELIGNQTGEELDLQDLMHEITAQEIDKIIYGG